MKDHVPGAYPIKIETISNAYIMTYGLLGRQKACKTALELAQALSEALGLLDLGEEIIGVQTAFFRSVVAGAGLSEENPPPQASPDDGGVPRPQR
jgi:hypothetical protein